MITERTLVNVHHRHPHWIRSDNLRGEEQEIYKALKLGATVEKSSRLRARIQTRRFRPRIHWREEFMNIATPDQIAEVEERFARNKAEEFEYLVVE